MNLEKKAVENIEQFLKNKFCMNCADFDAKKEVCTIRDTILEDKTKTPMKRKPNQIGCKVFMRK